MIPFNIPPQIPKGLEYISDAVWTGKMAGDGKYTTLCSSLLSEKLNAKKILLTTSCSSALVMTALLLNIQPEDEVIMPSYTFVSTANAYALFGARIVFVDIRPDTMNIDETKIEAAITKKTKAIVIVHYAGNACEMDVIISIAKKYNLPIIEDAAQAIFSTYKNRALGTIGTFGCLSFHETKNLSMGEGGALIINDKKYIKRAEFIREKGTNRSSFFRGEIDKYSWIDIGSSFLPSEINCAYLYSQLEIADSIIQNRKLTWNSYYQFLQKYKKSHLVELPMVTDGCIHNGHIFYFKVKDLNERTYLLNYLKENNIGAVFHYIPLHSSIAGKIYSTFHGNDIFTTTDSERLIRLPLYYNLQPNDFNHILHCLENYFSNALISRVDKED